jgi:hypothetical protein
MTHENERNPTQTIAGKENKDVNYPFIFPVTHDEFVRVLFIANDHQIQNGHQGIDDH